MFSTGDRGIGSSPLAVATDADHAVAPSVHLSASCSSVAWWQIHANVAWSSSAAQPDVLPASALSKSVNHGVDWEQVAELLMHAQLKLGWATWRKLGSRKFDVNLRFRSSNSYKLQVLMDPQDPAQLRVRLYPFRV